MSRPQDDYVTEERRITPVIATTDVLVVGGGIAGCTAAVAAARNRAKVLLIENLGFLGGTATSGLVGCFCGLYTCSPGYRQVVYGLAQEMVKKLENSGAGFKLRHRFHVDYEHLKCCLDEWLVSAGVQLLFHTRAIDVIKNNGTISHVIIENKNGRSAIKAKTVIDCTGDGDVAVLAGEEFWSGGSDGKLQAATTIFYMGNVDMEQALSITEEEVGLLLEKAVADGAIKVSRLSGSYTPSPFPGRVHVNMTRINGVDGTDATSHTAGEIEGRRQVKILADFLRRYVPGFAEASVDAIGTVGIRETRQIVGQEVLTGDDVLSGRKFKNAICRSAWPIEEHPPGSMETRRIFLKEDDYYHIPLGCLLPRKTKNLLVAGRCISVDHQAQASVRVMGSCFGTGQAAGTAAALAVVGDCTPWDLDVEQVQRVLKQQGVLL